MTAGLVLVAALVLMDVLLTGWALVGLGKLRMDQQMELAVLKWLWEKELKREKEKGFK
jgi:hypothetical protein